MDEPNPSTRPAGGRQPALRIALIYAAVSAIWIYSSDELLMLLFGDAPLKRLTHLQSLKGLAFVIVTTLMLYLLVRRSIARLKQSQAELRQREYHYRQLIETANEGIWSIDADARTTFVNPRMAEMLGYTSQEMAGRPMYDFMDESAAEEARRNFEHRRHGQRAEHDFRFRHRAGHDVWTRIVACPLYENGQFAGALALITDTTQQRCYEFALRLSQARFEGFMRHLPGVAFMKDAAGRMLFVDGAFEDRFLISTSNWLGKTNEQIWPPDTARQIIQNDQAVLRDKTVVQAIESIPQQDGVHHWLVSKFPIEAPDHSTLIGGIAIDVTQRLQAEAEIRRLNADLEERVQQRTAQWREANEDLESLIYMLSTDLRAAMRGMQDFAKALLQETGDTLPEASREYAARIVGAAARMHQQVQDLLDVARVRRQPLPLERTSLSLVVHEVLGRIEREHAASGPLITAEHYLPDVIAHRATLSQVLYCLLDNAVKFVSPGVRPQIRITATICSHRVRLWIEDNGIGIDLSDQQRIFGAFNRTERAHAYPGSGVGLMIVHKGMSRMNGSSGVESAPRQGSRFWIELPLAKTESNTT